MRACCKSLIPVCLSTWEGLLFSTLPGKCIGPLGGHIYPHPPPVNYPSSCSHAQILIIMKLLATRTTTRIL